MSRLHSLLIDICAAAAGLVLLALVVSLAGCSDEEKVLDVEGPGVDLEVIENTETGEMRLEGEIGEEEE